jgi:hypothetical protein
VSEDVELLLTQWAKDRGFKLPNTEFFVNLLDALVGKLTQIFGEVRLAKAEVISSQLKSLVTKSGLPAVSMDGVYFQSPYTIQVNRAVDSLGNDVGLFPRPGALPLQEQFQKIRDSGLTRVILVDDVVFSGHQMGLIIQGLAKWGVSVAEVLSGVSIGDGEQLIQRMAVGHSSVYSMQEVIDEVCQRDFFPGVPRCGRWVSVSGNYGMPYLLPFGNPQKWASIPELYEKQFSLFCLAQTLKLFEAIEKISGRLVMCEDLDRRPLGFPELGHYTGILRRIYDSHLIKWVVGKCPQDFAAFLDAS